MTRPSARRQGFLYFAVLAMMGILLLVGMYFVNSYRHRHRQTYRYGGEEVAFYLARAGVAQVSFALRQCEDPKFMYQELKLKGPLAHVLLNTPKALEKYEVKINKTGWTPDSTLNELLGGANLGDLRRLVEATPGAQLHLRVRFEVDEAEPVPAYVDPVKKLVTVRISSKCTYRDVDRVVHGRVKVRIHSLLPPVTSKYTLFAPRLAKSGANTHPALGDGKAPGVYPAVCFHGKATETGGSGSSLGGAPGPRDFADLLDAVKKAGEKRGWVFLGGTAGGVDLHLEGGPPPWGQHGLLYRLPPDAPASEARPLSYDLAEQPEGVANLDAPSVQAPEKTMRAWLRGAFWGHHVGQDPEGVLGAVGEEASSLRIFGTHEEPDPTLCGGRAFFGYGAFSNLNVDRDRDGQDESDQERFYDHPVEERDAIDPFFRATDRATFTRDLAREENSPRPGYTGLAPFQSHGLAPWFVLNLHGEAPSELNFQPLALDPAFFRYGKLFETWECYGRCMSKADRYPCNLAPTLMALDREPAFRLLEAKSFGPDWEGDEYYADLILEAPTIRNRDSLHERLGEGAELHYDGESSNASTLAAFDPNSLMPRTVTVWDQKEFELRFMAGGLLDLEGHHVVVRHPRTGLSRLVFDKTIALAPRSGGTVSASEIHLAGVEQVEGEVDFAPVTFHADRLKLLPGGEPHQAILRCSSLETGGGTSTNPDEIDLIHGSLFWDGSTFESRRRRLEIHWDERLDPGGETASHLYRLLVEDAYPNALRLDREGRQWREGER